MSEFSSTLSFGGGCKIDKIGGADMYGNWGSLIFWACEIGGADT